MTKKFLTADWRKLIMANYSVDPACLKPYLPAGTELDLWNNTCYVSLVGFMFLNTAVKGIRFPFHTNFEEVNLRFYVRYKDGEEWKRGVVFIQEIVPKPAITFVTRTIYGEHYVTLPMHHQWKTQNDILTVSYQWKKKSWQTFTVRAHTKSQPISNGSEAEFITEHYWGYTRHNEKATSEYEVQHPRWEIYPVIDYTVDVDFGTVYGSAFAFLNQVNPVSVYLAEGSEIVVKEGKKLWITQPETSLLFQKNITLPNA